MHIFFCFIFLGKKYIFNFDTSCQKFPLAKLDLPNRIWESSKIVDITPCVPSCHPALIKYEKFSQSYYIASPDFRGQVFKGRRVMCLYIERFEQLLLSYRANTISKRDTPVHIFFSLVFYVAFFKNPHQSTVSVSPVCRIVLHQWYWWGWIHCK